MKPWTRLAVAALLLAALREPSAAPAWAASSDHGLPPPGVWVDTADSEMPTTDEAELLNLLNSVRVPLALPPVEFDPVLLPLARQRATDQLVAPSMSHLDASGQYALFGLLSEAQVPFTLAGENLARLSRSDGAMRLVQNAFMSSPSHRLVILEPSFDRVAVGVREDALGRMAVAEIFRALP